MAGYIENTTFGMAPINLKGATTSALYVGAEVDESKRDNKFTSAAAAKGLDWGSTRGTYNSKMSIAIYLVKKIEAADDATITFSICQSKELDKNFEEGWNTLKCTVAELNKALHTPIVFTPASTMKQYICLKLQPSAAIADGAIRVSAEYKGY